MNQLLNELNQLIYQIDEVGVKLNSCKDELRQKDFDLKVTKSRMEFSPDFADFREGLKVKEIGPKILEETVEQAQEICVLKQHRDELEHELYVLKLKFQYVKEVIDSQNI